MQTESELHRLDANHVWHPYTSVIDPLPVYAAEEARGTRIRLTDGRELVDGMASWWCVIHGYNHPELNRALREQAETMSHVMFGGITHRPAADLAGTLAEISPPGLDRVFFSDSGSVAVEVALKMALQYWQGRGETQRKEFVALRRGYHGDTFGAMSVSDPEMGMHEAYSGFLPGNRYIRQPECGFGDPCRDEDLAELRELLRDSGNSVAAIVLEPVVQGAGGMRFYSPQFLAGVRELASEYGVLLIADEIATGFGRTGRMFACEHAGISPDIMCLGKALTGGYMSLAATLCQEEVARTICQSAAGVFMHGPTFMGNPLACSVARASVDLLLASPWQERVQAMEGIMREELAPALETPGVKDVRVLGGIGVVQMEKPLDLARSQKRLVDMGVWIRPFGDLLYIMPPYVIEEADLRLLCRAMRRLAREEGA